MRLAWPVTLTIRAQKSFLIKSFTGEYKLVRLCYDPYDKIDRNMFSGNQF